jgi:hypothetical protein
MGKLVSNSPLCFCSPRHFFLEYMKSMWSPPDVMNCCPSYTQVRDFRSVIPTRWEVGTQTNLIFNMFIHQENEVHLLPQAGLWGPPSLVPNVHWGLFTQGYSTWGTKPTTHLNPMWGVKNMQSCISTLLSTMAWCLIRKRDTFTSIPRNGILITYYSDNALNTFRYLIIS